MTVSDNQACAKLKELSTQFEQDAERLEQADILRVGQVMQQC